MATPPRAFRLTEADLAALASMTRPGETATAALRRLLVAVPHLRRIVDEQLAEIDAMRGIPPRADDGRMPARSAGPLTAYHMGRRDALDMVALLVERCARASNVGVSRVSEAHPGKTANLPPRPPTRTCVGGLTFRCCRINIAAIFYIYISYTYTFLIGRS